MPPKKTIPQYAAKSTVEPDDTRRAIEKLLNKYGAEQMAFGRDGSRYLVAFVLEEIHIRFTLTEPEELDFARNSLGHTVGQAQRQATHRQAIRSMWRQLLHRIESRLIEAYSPWSTVYEEFFWEVVLSDGTTMGERYPEAVYREMKKHNALPPVLPGLALPPPPKE